LSRPPPEELELDCSAEVLVPLVLPLDGVPETPASAFWLSIWLIHDAPPPIPLIDICLHSCLMP
jgi:hypothetical protein